MSEALDKLELEKEARKEAKSINGYKNGFIKSMILD